MYSTNAAADEQIETDDFKAARGAKRPPLLNPSDGSPPTPLPSPKFFLPAP
jgi:hypothetical protein